MHPISSSARRARRTPLSLLFMGFALALVLVGCGSSSTPTSSVPTVSASTPTVAAPTGLITPGTLTVGSDLTYPPQEFLDPQKNPTGFDIDLITAVAARMGLKVNIVNNGFDTIFDSLTAKRFDVVISAVTINADREKKFDFVPYFQAGESLLVKKGNPKALTSIDAACGLNVGVQTGTVEQTDAQAASAACTKAGKTAITITALQNETDVVQLLVTGRVDATYQDSPVTDYYIYQNPGQFEVGGSVANAAAEGIVIRKGETGMQTAIQQAFDQVKGAGIYDQLFTKWSLSNGEKVTWIDRRSVQQA